MSDFKNPFDPDNFSLGVGWDGKTVTVTASQFQVDKFEYGDGTPVVDKTGQQAYANVWAISGVTEDSDSERTEKYSIGKTLVPTSGGDSFEHVNGKPGATFNTRAKAAKLAAALKASGFPLEKLVDGDGRPSASGLLGAMFVFKGERLLNPDGSVKTDKNGYEKIEYYPVEFLGFNKNAPASKDVDNEVRNRAYDLVTNLLGEAEGKKLTRIQLIQAVTKALAGDADKNTILGLVVSDEFNSAAPWKVEGTTISLS